jgi:putative flippase GtrA
VFVDSNLKGRIQLFRYFLAFLLNLVINYFMQKLLIDSLHIEAFTSQLIITFILITVSYLSQKHFSFRVKAMAEI